MVTWGNPKKRLWDSWLVQILSSVKASRLLTLFLLGRSWLGGRACAGSVRRGGLPPPWALVGLANSIQGTWIKLEFCPGPDGGGTATSCSPDTRITVSVDVPKPQYLDFSNGFAASGAQLNYQRSASLTTGSLAQLTDRGQFGSGHGLEQATAEYPAVRHGIYL